MPLKARKKRAACDKSVTVSMCMELLDAALGASRDMSTWFGKLEEKWKHQPDPSEMMPYLPITLAFSKICPSLLVQPSRMVIAISKLHLEKGPCNFTGQKVEDWAEEMSGKLRCLFSKWRRVFLESYTRSKFMGKLSQAEKEEVEKLLSIMGKSNAVQKACVEGDELNLPGSGCVGHERCMSGSCPKNAHATKELLK